MQSIMFALLTLKARFEDQKERGATAVEYGLMVAAIAVAIVVIIFTLGDNIFGMFDEVNTGIENRGGE